jgi:uncharacterized protein
MGQTTRLRLRVSPGSRKNELAGRYGDGWKVRVSAPPEDGRANDAVLELLSERVGLPRRSLAIVSGRASRNKVVEMTGIDREEAERRMETSLAMSTSGRAGSTRVAV